MPVFSQRSKDKLAECHEDLQTLMNAVIVETDIIILCGHRGEQEQNEAYRTGKSKLMWPNGKHNKLPALAVDVAPYPIDWNNIERFKELAVIIKRIAGELGINVKWGGDWQSFKDYPHWEL